jgi:hypothetical protein
MMSTPKRGSSKEKLRLRLHGEEPEQRLEGGEKLHRAEDGEPSAPPPNSQPSINEAVPSHPGGSSNGDFLNVVTRLVNMVEKEHASLLVAEELRHNAELRAAGLQGEITLERELRRRTEAKLQKLKAMVEELRQQVSGRIDRLASEDAASGHEPGAATTAGKPVESSAMTSSSSAEPDGRHVIAPGGGQEGDAGVRGSEATEGIETMHSRAAASSTPGNLDAVGHAAAEEEPPPLPPGWRYATDLPPKKKRWGLWGKDD